MFESPSPYRRGAACDHLTWRCEDCDGVMMHRGPGTSDCPECAYSVCADSSTHVWIQPVESGMSAFERLPAATGLADVTFAQQMAQA